MSFNNNNNIQNMKKFNKNLNMISPINSNSKISFNNLLSDSQRIFSASTISKLSSKNNISNNQHKNNNSNNNLANNSDQIIKELYRSLSLNKNNNEDLNYLKNNTFNFNNSKNNFIPNKNITNSLIVTKMQILIF